jgi:hypothetical protein
MPTEICRTWVVYRMTLSKGMDGGNVVCEQREWDAIERSRPSYHLLVQSGIATEQEAEKLARGTAGDARPRKSWEQKRADRVRRDALYAELRPQYAVDLVLGKAKTAGSTRG